MGRMEGVRVGFVHIHTAFLKIFALVVKFPNQRVELTAKKTSNGMLYMLNHSTKELFAFSTGSMNPANVSQALIFVATALVIL